jgi:hypothetical protein
MSLHYGLLLQIIACPFFFKKKRRKKKNFGWVISGFKSRGAQQPRLQALVQSFSYTLAHVTIRNLYSLLYTST